SGQPFIGKAGHYLWGNLKRIGLDRDDFRIANVLSCRPPGNKLVGQGYELDAIDHCAPLLDATIKEYGDLSRASGRTPVILTLGRTPFKRIMDLNERVHAKLLKLDYYCYPFWSDRYSAWVIAAPHPSYLMRGNHHLL